MVVATPIAASRTGADVAAAVEAVVENRETMTNVTTGVVVAAAGINLVAATEGATPKLAVAVAVGEVTTVGEAVAVAAEVGEVMVT